MCLEDFITKFGICQAHPGRQIELIGLHIGINGAVPNNIPSNSFSFYPILLIIAVILTLCEETAENLPGVICFSMILRNKPRFLGSLILKIRVLYLFLYFVPTSLLKRRYRASSTSVATCSTVFSSVSKSVASLQRFHSVSFSELLDLARVDSGSGWTTFFDASSSLDVSIERFRITFVFDDDDDGDSPGFFELILSVLILGNDDDDAGDGA